MGRAKVHANGMLSSANARKKKDNFWGTPEFMLERVRVGFGGPIPFDPASTHDNPTKALRYCAGVPGTLFAGTGPLCLGCQGEGFIDDPAAPPATALSTEDPPALPCPDCYSARRNGLEIEWDPIFFVNPPFTPPWIKKLGREVERGSRGFAILPCNRYEEPYFQKVLSLAAHVCHVDAAPFQVGYKQPHRVAFISSRDSKPVMSNPFATQVLNFGMPAHAFLEAFEPLGPCWRQQRISLRGVPAFNGAFQAIEETEKKLAENFAGWAERRVARG